MKATAEELEELIANLEQALILARQLDLDLLSYLLTMATLESAQILEWLNHPAASSTSTPPLIH